MTRHIAKVKVAELGGQGAVAKRLGVTREHLCRVLNGDRESRRLLRAIQTLSQKGS